MKKFITLLLALITIFTMAVPGFAADVSATPSDPINQEDIRINENGFTYIDNLASVYSAGAKNLTNGLVLSGFATIAAIPLCAFPFGAIAVFAGIPGGIALTVIGVGELATAPIIAAFMDESTNLKPIEGFDAEEVLSPLFNNN